MTEPAEKLREEIAELRRELADSQREMADLRALLRATLNRRRPKKIERTSAPVELPPEVRASVRAKMVRAAAKRR